MIDEKTKFLTLALVLVLSPHLAAAGDEVRINEQLQNGGLIRLPAGNYILTDSIILQDNVILEGEAGTVLTIKDNAGWAAWKPLISGTGIKNVTIRNIEFNGNADNQPVSHGKGYYNFIHVIDCDSIEVYDCLMHDSKGDGLRTKYCSNIKFHDNTAYKLGHDGFFGIDSQNIECYNNRITTRTNSALRIFNSAHVRFFDNIIDAQLDSQGGNPGVQIEDSTGTLSDIEVCGNIISKTWGSGIWLIAYEKGLSNNQAVSIHHNLFWQVAQSYNIGYAAGITNNGENGAQIKNNVFDSARNSAYLVLSGGSGSILQDNIITNTVEHTGISQAGTGYGIADRSGDSLSIMNNCFFGNQNGNLYGCTSSGDDLEDPKTHITSSGWTWTGSTWVCDIVKPADLGEIEPAKPANHTDTDTHEIIFDDIFDILTVEYSDSGRTEQTAEDITFSVQETEQGKIAGGIKIIGFQDLININGVSYIPDEKSILVKYAAVKAPSFDLWNMGVSDIKTNVETKIENGTAYAVLTVKMKYYTLTDNKLTGKTKKNTHISTATFKDSCQAPEILKRPTDAYGIITYYNNSVNPHTLVYVPSEGLTKIIYEYEGNYSEHTLMIGERGKNENGVQITNFSTCDYWRGSIPYQGNALFLRGSVDQSKLNITCFTPYESFKVTKFEYTEKTWNGQSFSDWVLPFVLKLGVILFFLLRLLRIPFS